jgi:predicted polyphosphate/ATP-dependent NAD kinase
MTAKKKLGLIVNPIAGMGGKVGLKGTDGHKILERAIRLGARQISPKRTMDALNRLVRHREELALFTYPGDMGENECRQCGIFPLVMGKIEKGKTSGKDTQKAAKDMLKQGVDLLLFAGGDGTARDVYVAIGNRLPALGIPAGVKIHSAVYGISPAKTGELAALYVRGNSSEVCLLDAEVMDIDEESFRENRVSARLFGYLKIPFAKKMVQCAKAGDCAGEQQALGAIAADVINNMERDCLYIVGTGTTTRAIMEQLGLKNTLLGVDAVLNKELVGSDLNETELLPLLEGGKAKIFVGVIGRQGYIFGRGNQQISPKIIRRVGRENVVVLATMDKIASLGGAPLLVDTGDEKLDQHLSGYMQVISGLGERIMLRIDA